MAAGKTRDFPPPCNHRKCATCELSLVCLSGRRKTRFGWWCMTCRGLWHDELRVLVQCVSFRDKRGTYRDQRHTCPVCAPHPAGAVHATIVGITHEDAKTWREGR